MTHRNNLKQLLSEFSLELLRLKGTTEEEKKEEKKTLTLLKNLDNTVVVGNFDGTEKEIKALFEIHGEIAKVTMNKALFLTEITFVTKEDMEKCLVMNGTTVQSKCLASDEKNSSTNKNQKINVQRYSALAPRTFQDGSCVGPIPDQALKEEYKYQEYPF